MKKEALLIGLLTIVGLLLVFSKPLKRVVKYLSPNTNKAIILASDAQSANSSQFPIVSGLNLLGEQFNLPEDFSALYNIVVIAYTQEHQNDVYTWLPILAETEVNYSEFRYYELPTLPSYNPVFRAQIDGWMIAGIPDEDTRSRTITLYLDVDAFNEGIGVGNTQDIQILLVSAEGKILWQESGAFSEEKGNSLLTNIHTLDLSQSNFSDNPGK
jgi:hypothetical protein